MAIDWSKEVSWMLFPASASRLDQAQCGYSFEQARRSRRVPAYVWENLVFGGDMHNIFEDVLNAKKLDPDAPIAVNDLVEKHLSPRIASRAGEMAKLADLFAERFRFSENIEGVELRLAVDNQLKPCGYADAICNSCKTVVPDGIPKSGLRRDYPECPSCGSWTHPRPIFRGIIDLLELVHLRNRILLGVVNDHKTQMNLLDAEDLLTHFQLVGYAFLVSVHYPQVTALRVQIYFARYGITRWMDIGPDHIARWTRILKLRLRHVMQYTEETFKTASPCSYCQLCEYKPVCPAIAGWVDELDGEAPEMMTDADAPRMARRWIALKALVSEYESSLKDHVAVSGPIDLGSADGYPVVSYRPVDSYEFPVDTFYELLLKEGVDPSRMGKLSATTIKAVINKLPEDVRDRLMAEAPKRLSTRFEAKKTNPMEDR